MSTQEFTEIERQLEETLAEMKQTENPQLRRAMLANMRLLLAEADRLLREF